MRRTLSRADDAEPAASASVRGGGQAALTPTAWAPRGQLALGEWAEHGRRLGMMGRGVGWWIGDWLNYGNAKYGEKYSRAVKLTGYDVQTLKNMVYVASRFETSRRRDDLSWTHHAEVAALPTEEQEVWLSRAVADRLSVRSLREEIALTQAARRRQSRPRLKAPDGVVCPACGFAFPGEDQAEEGAGAHSSRDPLPRP